jgi:hypothetical protein
MKAIAEYCSEKEFERKEKLYSLNVFLISNIFTLFPVVKELVVSAGKSVQITLPKNEVQLNAYVLQDPPEGKNHFILG